MKESLQLQTENNYPNPSIQILLTNKDYEIV